MYSPIKSDHLNSTNVVASKSVWGFKENLLEALQRISNYSQIDPDYFNPKSVSNSSSNSNNLINCLDKQTAYQTAICEQPQIAVTSLHRSKEISVDSLDTLDSGQCMTYNHLADCPSGLVNSGPESGIVSGHETSFECSEIESNHDEDVESQTSSINSWNSSTDDQLYADSNEPISKFMRQYVNKIFSDSTIISQVEKSLFGVYSQTNEGRVYFSRYINEQRVYCKEVNESTFYSLVQYFAIVLFECEQANDFSPAKTLMNMSFTFYYEPQSSRNCNQVERRHYLYEYLTEQPIWRSINFWSNAFNEAISKENNLSPSKYSRRNRFIKFTIKDESDEARQQENTIFGLLGAFTYYIKEFGLAEKFCLQFLKKQAKNGKLSKEQTLILQQNVSAMYHR